ncbi:MAG: efflux RND transporter permease subunit [Acidobacteriota bacterium]
MQKLAEICIRRPVFATMLILALVVVGLDSYRKLGVDFFPKVEFPFVSITTVLPGASPEEVESQVTKVLEEAVNTISGIDELNSTSAEGVSIITIGFVLEKDPEIAAQEVRDKVSTVLGQLPRDARTPVVEKLATDAAPVLNVVISSQRDLREVTKIVDDHIKKNIETINGVGQVRFVGERKRQIQVLLDPEKLAAYNVNIEQVRMALAAQNIEIPGGRIDEGNRELTLRTLGRVEQPLDFARIIVATVNGAPVRVSDIGEVQDSYEEPRSVARLNGKPAVALAVRKQAGTNSLDVIAAIKQRIEELRPTLPPDFEITYTRDQSGFIRASYNAVLEHLILGGFFAAIIVLFFIRNWRSTLIAAIAIPTSIISTFSLLNWMGFSLNQITMLALTLVVGIVIDDAIVVLENIFRNMEEKNLTAMEAAFIGTKEIGLAVLATTLSLIIIFIPIAVMPGIVGRFMSSFGYTAAFAVGISLIVSFTLTPMLCSRFLKLGGHGKSTKAGFFDRIFASPYKKMLVWSLNHRWAVALAALAVMLSTVPMVRSMGVDFLPTDDQSEFEINVRMPVGSSLDGTSQVMEMIEKDLAGLPGVRDLFVTIGADQRRQVDRGSIIVELVDVKQRKQSQRQLMDMARERLAKYRDLIVTVQLPSLISGAPNSDFMFSIQGPDLNRLEKYANSLMARLRQVPGMADMELTYESGKPEVRVQINRDKAADLNVNVAQIANAMRVLVGGDDQATTYKEGDDRYDVMLRVAEPYRNSPRTLERLYVPSATLGNVALSNVATFELGTGPTSIDRYNRQRRVLIMGNLSKNLALGDLINIASQHMDSLNMPPGYTYGTVGRSRELGRAVRNFFIAFLLSIVFMYMVLASNYESFIDPVTILLSLPLSAPFALLSLFIARENFSIVYTSLGILVLFGIVKKNSILQIDHIKGLRREGMPRLEAIIQGCEDRLRPILMTTAALVAGMIPLALGTGAGSGSRRTVAIVVIGGQSLALLLTLLVTPVAYSLFDDVAHSRLWRRLFARVPKPSPTTAAMFVLALLAAPAVLSAQPAPGSPGGPLQAARQQVLHAPRVGVSDVLRELTLKQALELALKNNLEIEIERSYLDTSAALIRSARGAFDPLVQYNPSFDTRNLPVANTLAAPGGRLSEKYLNHNFYVRGKTPFSGLSWHIDFENQRQSTNNPFTALTPFLTSRLGAGFTLPLLRFREVDPDRAQLRIRLKQRDQQRATFELKVIDVVTRTQSAYWDLAAAIEDATVAADGVRLAREQHERNLRFIEAGTLAQVESAASEAELQRRMDSFQTTLTVLAAAENQLKTILTPNPSDPLWNERLVPVDARALPPPALTVEEALSRALRQRLELRSLELSLDQNRTQIQLASSALKPQVMLTANYFNSGLAGALAPNTGGGFANFFGPLFERVNTLSGISGLPPLPPVQTGGAVPASLIGGYGSTLSNLATGNFQTVSAGISFEWNPRNRAAQGQLEQAAIQERRLRLTRTQIEQGIAASVRTALQNLEAARLRIDAARSSERAAREKLESEIRLYQTGESTNFLVLTRQNELLDSRRRVVAAELLLNRAVAQLQQAIGSTLDANQIRLD